MTQLILPGDPLFNLTLYQTPPPNWREVTAATGGDFTFIVRPGSEVMEPVTQAQARDYLNSGEYEEREQDIIQADDDWVIF
ncbi:MAG: hypothetical protein AAF215_27910 [Cyanobacteria bacterium P01_A01_bin.123]